MDSREASVTGQKDKAGATARDIKIFISSPGDVQGERVIAERVVAQLDAEFSYHFRVRSIVWERQPLLATAHFQEELRPRDSDIAVVILWSRLGTVLPVDRYPGPLSRKPVTGTEWEFEDAFAAYQSGKRPELLLYRKRSDKIPADLSDEARVREQLAQKRLVEEFFAAWFRDETTATFKLASHEFRTTDEFEDKLKSHLRELLLRRLDGAAALGRTIRWHDGSPFRGLQSFELKHTEIFFGRRRARNELRERLEAQAKNSAAFVMVLGGSGSGKSSLVKAGLLPDLLRGVIGRVALVRHMTMRPGADTRAPLRILVEGMLEPGALPELAALDYKPATLADALASESMTRLALSQGLKRAGEGVLSPHGEARLLIIVDQFEELFTRTDIAEDARLAYVAALESLARSGLAWVVATMRSDFYDRLDRLPALLRLVEGDGQYLLARPDAADIAQIIREPASLAGVSFDIDRESGANLDDVIRQAASSEGASLPMLQFLLDQLWNERSADGRLTFEAYGRLGGLKGALGQRAKEVFDTQPPEVRSTLPRVLRALVAIDEAAEAQPVARSCRLADFDADSDARRLVDALSAPDARLLAIEGSGADAIVRPAHEALLSGWPSAVEVIAEDREFLRTRGRVERAATRWYEEKQTDDLLLSPGRPLAEAKQMLESRREDLDRRLATYVESSIATEQARIAAETAREQALSAAKAAEQRLRLKRTRIAAAVMACLGLLATGLGVVSLFAYLRADRAEEIAKVEAGHARTEGEHALVARKMADIARENSERNAKEARDAQAAAERSAIDAQRAKADAERSLRAEIRAKTAWLIEQASGALLDDDLPLAALRSAEALALQGRHSDERQVAKVRAIIDAARNARQPAVAGLPVGGSVIAFSPDSRYLAVGGPYNVTTIFRTDTWIRIGTIATPDSTAIVHRLAFSPDSREIAIATADQFAGIWRLDDMQMRVRIEGHEASDKAITVLKYSPDGRLLLTTDGTGAFVLTDVATGEMHKRVTKHRLGIHDADFSADGSRMVTAGLDNAAHVWSIPDLSLVASFRGQGNWVLSARFSPDGRAILTTGDSAEAKLWQADDGKLVKRFAVPGRGILMRGEFLDAHTIALVSRSGTVSVFFITATEVADIFAPHDRQLSTFTLGGKGRTVAAMTAADGRSVAVWSLKSRVSPAHLRIEAQTYDAAAISPDGRLVAGAGPDMTGVWRLADLDLDEGQKVRDISLGGSTVPLSDNSGFLVFSEHSTEIWRFADLSGPAVQLRDLSTRISQAAASPDGKWIGVVGRDGDARLFDTVARAQHKVLELPAEHIAFSRNGQRVITSFAGTAVVWDVASGSRIAFFRGKAPDENAMLSANGRLLLLPREGGADRFELIDADSGRRTAVPGPPEGVDWAGFLHNGWVVLAGLSGNIVVYDPETRREITTLYGHRTRIQRIALSDDASQLLTADRSGGIRIWPTATFARATKFDTREIVRRAWLDARHGMAIVWTGGETTPAVHRLRIWSIAAEVEIRTVKFDDEQAWVELDRQSWRIIAMSTKGALRTIPLGGSGTTANVQFAADADLAAYARATAFARFEVLEPQPAAGALACDRLAANPADPDRKAPGVTFADLQPAPAIMVCRGAIEQSPNLPRLRYQLARALEKGGLRVEALEMAQAADRAGYHMAKLTIATLVSAMDKTQAEPLLRAAAASGVAAANQNLGNIHWHGQGVAVDKEKAVAFWRLAAAAGFAPAHGDIAMAYETGQGVPVDIERAFFHHVAAEQLFRLRGDVSNVRYHGLRRATIARNMEPATVARLFQDAWRATTR